MHPATSRVSPSTPAAHRHRPRAWALAALLVAGPACIAAAQEPAAAAPSFVPAIPAEPAGAAVIDDGVVYRELTRGIYEVVSNPQDGAVYVASALSAPNVSGGVVYQLDPATLEPIGAIHTDLRNFGLALRPDGKRLYVTNSLEHGVTAIDLETRSVVGRLRFDEADSQGHRYGPRQVVYDRNRDLLYVGAVGDPAVIWVVDAGTLELRHTIRDAGKWLTGLLLHPRTGDLYAANGGGEILRIDTTSHTIVDRFKPAGDDEALLLNLALDAEKNLLYVTDHSKLKTTLVVDPDSGRKVGEIDGAGDSMGIVFNAARRELYIGHRDQGTVSVVDADTHAVKRTIRAAPNPNSLALSADGKALYVTVKTPFTKTYHASGVESVVRIPLE
ncbi:YncE family protein [Luteimonas sp. BDR2-5]|uniref:YncE family protein n=1 Tax=Proluteimonas luteida TaxID=2878685 RepID=UPI001E62438A|nr:YncE family protein [Luteimonas sp. BDR2-5]MCD9027166.1 YncE family protein [Luteimonas sp. BDR2-5]